MDDRHDTLSSGADIRFRYLATDALELPAGLEFRYDGAESTKIDSRSRYHAGAYAAPVLAVSQGLKVSPSVRLDWYDDYPAGLTYSLGASAAVSEAVTLKATAGRSYRAPAFNDLYWPLEVYDYGIEGYRMWGNPNLLPETSWYAEAGAVFTDGTLSASVSVFSRYTEDLITWSSSFDGYWYDSTPENLAAAAFFGADTEAYLQSGPLSVSAYYALLLSYDLSSGNTLADEVRVANQPVHAVRLESSYSFGTMKVLARMSWKSEYADPFGNTLHPAVLLGARIQYEATDSMHVYLDGENLLNQANAEMKDYPMPGITLKAGVRIVLD